MNANGTVVWLTGLPAAGKTTVARHLVGELRAREVSVLWLDSDELRSALTPNPTYSPEERDLFYGALGLIAVRAAAGGVLVVVSATACKRAYRDFVRGRVSRFVEVLLICDPQKLRGRDPKGLYAKAAGGAITSLPGVGAPYEDPKAPELVIDTGDTEPGRAAAEILRTITNTTFPSSREVRA